MTKRPHISERVKVNVAIEQAGGWIRCVLCSGPLRPSEPRILEHLVPHELSGSSREENLRWVHKGCATRKTNGSKATSAGGDIHKIAKSKRLAKATQTHAAIVAKTESKKPGSIRSRPFPKTQNNWRK